MDIGRSLKDAIGAKGEPKSIGDSVVEVNPYYNRNFREYSENCQRCVVAYELRRRGYDVTAMPTYMGDRLPRIAYFDPKNGIYEGRWKGAFQGAKSIGVGVPGNTSSAESKVISNIEDRMKEFGNGARAVVQILYRGGGGHVFNVENQNGRIVYVEAQAGKLKDIADTMRRVKTDTVTLVRTDNLKISDRAKKFVRKSTRR